MKRLGVLCSLLLVGCSSVEVPLPPYVQPEQPAALVVAQGLSSAARDANLSDPLEASMIREAGPLAPAAPGAYVACVRSAAAPRLPYAVFFRSNKLNVARLALTPDHCFDQTYRPFIRVEVPKPELPGG